MSSNAVIGSRLLRWPTQAPLSFATSHPTTPPPRGHASRLGSGPTILPGLSRFFGSKTRSTRDKPGTARRLDARPTASARSRAVLCADRAAERESQHVDRFRDRPELHPIGRVFEVAQGPCMNLAREDVDQKRPGHLGALENILHPREVFRKRIGRHADILDERERSRSFAEAEEPRDCRFAHAPDARLTFRCTRPFREEASSATFAASTTPTRARSPRARYRPRM